MTLEEKLRNKGFEVVINKTGYHLKPPNLFLYYFGNPNSEDYDCIKAYLRVDPNKLEEIIEKFLPLVESNEIMLKYHPEGKILQEKQVNLIPVLFGLDPVEITKAGYNICIYIPYNKEILKTVIRIIQGLEYNKLKFFIGKTLYHKKIRLEYIDIKEIIFKTLNKLIKKLEESKKFIENHKNVYLIMGFSKLFLNNMYYEGKIEGNKFVAYTPKGKLEFKFNEKQRKEAEKIANELMKNKIKAINNSIKIYKEAIEEDSLNFLRILNGLKNLYPELKFINHLVIEDGGIYLVPNGDISFPDKFLEKIAIKEIYENIEISYLPSKESWKTEIMKILSPKIKNLYHKNY